MTIIRPKQGFFIEADTPQELMADAIDFLISLAEQMEGEAEGMPKAAKAKHLLYADGLRTQAVFLSGIEIIPRTPHVEPKKSRFTFRSLFARRAK